MTKSAASRPSLAFGCCFVIVVMALTAPAATITQQAYLKDFDPRESDGFGSAVAVSGDTMLIGSSGEFGDGHGAQEAGAAYVFVRTGTNWILQATLKAFNAHSRDQFGQSVALFGNTAVVGAPSERSNAIGVNGIETDQSAPRSGAAYVFVRNGTNWTQQAYLKASNAEGLDLGAYYGGDVFGYSVAISHDTIVIGAPDEESSAPGVNGDQSDNNAPRSGAAYVFVRNGTNWTQQAYLKASNPGGGEFDSFVGGDNFGWSVTVSGDMVVVGAPGEESNATEINGDQSDNSAYRCGAAYVFVRSGTNWSQEAYLKASDASPSDNFGCSVALSGNTVVAGAAGASTVAQYGPGAAYVFVRSGAQWTQQAILEPVNGVTGDEFGYAVTVKGDTAVIGAPYAGSFTGEGRATVFVRSGITWTLRTDLRPSPTSYQSGFGGDVALSGDTLVIAAAGDNEIVRWSGAVYVFTGLAPTPPRCDGFCITSFAVELNSVTIVWRSQAGETYYVAFKSALTDPNWTPISGGIIAQGAQASWTGPVTPGGNAFYCVVKL